MNRLLTGFIPREHPKQIKNKLHLYLQLPVELGIPYSCSTNPWFDETILKLHVLEMKYPRVIRNTEEHNIKNNIYYPMLRQINGPLATLSRSIM